MKTLKAKRERVRTAKTRMKRSVEVTADRFQTKLALMKMWEAAGTDPDYVQQLRREATKLRTQLRIKGVMFRDDGDEL
jgi:hypothetical protein